MGMGRRDLCSGTMGFSQNLGWEMGIRYPLQDPHLNHSEVIPFRPSQVTSCKGPIIIYSRGWGRRENDMIQWVNKNSKA